ncbi:MAG: ABC transporter substrate-binding protein [Actinomycetota bacterium]|nr:ABC transporter substrate-binding protein [Actinomycetota bacterium]
MRRIAVAAVFVAVISVLVGAAGAGAQDSSGKDEKLVFRMGNTNDIDVFNHFKIVEVPSYEVMGLTYDYLVNVSPKDSSPVPGLADSWEVSDDGLTWTFHLNKDAKWHDGKPVTSEDVAYTFNRILEEKQGLYIDYVRQIETIKTPDEHTVVFTTKEPSVQMLSMLVYILPKHIWEDVPADETKTFENEPAIGSGPFQAVEWKKGQSVRLVANPDYFRGAPHIDEIIFQFYDNDDTMVQALKNGEVDYIGYAIPINLFKSLKNQEGIETNSAPDPGFTELGFNLYEPSPEAIKEFGAPKTTTGNPALLDPLVREAINWAIDEEELTQKILQGEGIPGSTLVPPALAKYHLKLDESEIQGFDIERSKELLEQAGWKDTNGDGTVDKDGKELQLRLFVRSEEESEVTAGQFIEDWFKEAGIGLETKAISDTALTDAIYAADYDMFIWGWASDPDPDFLLSVLTCDQIMGWSDTFWCNRDYSRMYQEQKTQLDIEERAATIKEMQRIAYEENPYIIFYYDNQTEAWRTDKFEGWTKTPTSANPGQVAFTFTTETYMNLQPLSSRGAGGDGGGGTSPLLYVGLAAVAVAVIAGVVFFLRRGSAEDRA